MGTVSVCLPEELEAELEAYTEAEHLDRSAAVRKLLADRLESWRVDHALERLENDEVSFARAAEIADVSRWDLARLVEERDVTWVCEETLADDIVDP